MLAIFAAEQVEDLRVRGFAAAGLRRRVRELAELVGMLAAQGVTTPAGLTPAVMVAVQRQLAGQRNDAGVGLSLKAQATRLERLRGFVRWLVTRGELRADPTIGLVLPRLAPKRPHDALSEAQVAAVLAVPAVSTLLGVRDRALLELLYSTGLRRAECCALDLGDVRVVDGVVVVRRGKNGKDRLVPIGRRALKWLARYREEARSRLAQRSVIGSGLALFLTQQGQRLRPAGLGAVVLRVMTTAGIEVRGICHVFRHSMATHLLAHGAGSEDISRMLGHAQVRTTGIYTRVALETLRAHLVGLGPSPALIAVARTAAAP